MTSIELQTEYRSLVDMVAQRDTETIQRAVQALKKVLSPTKRQISKDDMVIDPRVSLMSVDMNLPASFDYKEERYKDYLKG